MSRIPVLRAMVVSVVLAGAVVAEGGSMLRLHIGPLWPRELLHSDKPTQWDLGLGYGIMVDKIIGVGVGMDFMWNRTANEVPVDSEPGLVELTRRESSYLFPVYAFVTIDPMSRFVVHPALTFNLGYNSMVYNFDDEQELTTGKAPENDPDGYYFGWFIRLALDALVNLGENAALFVGVDYQWANTRSAKTEDNTYQRRNMGGVGVKGGLRVIF
jgi:hypothetical protein